MKISRSRSSGSTSLSRAAAASPSATGSGSPGIGPGSPEGSTSSGSLNRRAASCLIASIARRRAVVVSHAPGLPGTPTDGQVRSAAA